MSARSWEIVAGLVLLVAVVIILVVLTGGDDDEAPEAGPPTTGTVTGPTATTPAGGPAGGSSTPSSLPADVPPSPLPGTPVALDAFDREDGDSLGSSDSGPVWVDQAGRWGIRDDAAAVIDQQEEGFRQVTVLDPEAVYMNQGTVSATFTDVQPGAGLVFRYRDAFNYFALVAQPQGRSWRLQRLVGGEATVLGLVPAGAFDGEVEVTVQLRGFNIDVYVDGQPRASMRDEQLGLAGTVGLFAGGEGERTTRYDGIAVSVSADALQPEDQPGEPPVPDEPVTTGTP